MASKTLAPPDSVLAATLPGTTFGEWHCGVIDADIERVWDALHSVRWSDLRFSQPLLAVRGLAAGSAGRGGGLRRGCLETFAPNALVVERPPHETAFVMIGKPWSPVPASRRVDDLRSARAFAEPGWLKYGMEWRLSPLPDGRTFIETCTLCEATDASARRRFTAYWLLIRAGSGLIRRELITAIRRLATAPTGSARRPSRRGSAPARPGQLEKNSPEKPFLR